MEIVEMALKDGTKGLRDQNLHCGCGWPGA